MAIYLKGELENVTMDKFYAYIELKEDLLEGHSTETLQDIYNKEQLILSLKELRAELSKRQSQEKKVLTYQDLRENQYIFIDFYNKTQVVWMDNEVIYLQQLGKNASQTTLRAVNNLLAPDQYFELDEV